MYSLYGEYHLSGSQCHRRELIHSNPMYSLYGEYNESMSSAGVNSLKPYVQSVWWVYKLWVDVIGGS